MSNNLPKVANSLSGLTVVELSSRVSVRFAGQLLAGCGAQVFYLNSDGLPAPESPAEASENDLLAHGKSPIDWDGFLGLQGTQDVILITEPRTLTEPFTSWWEATPRVEVAPIAFEAETSTWDAESLTLAHFSGLASVTPGGASEGDPPLRLPRKLLERTAGLSVATAVLALDALRARGIVTTARVSEARSLTPLVAPLISPYTRGEGTPIRTMPTLADLLTPCADGEVTFSFVQESEWQRFATLIGQPEWGEYFRGYQTRRENWEAIVELAAPWLNIRGKREIFDLCQAARVPCGMVQQPADVLANEQLAFRQFFQTLDTPSVGKTVIAPGLPWQSRVQLHARGRSNGARPVRSSTSSPGPQLPLSGQRVLELGGFWAAPRCAAILAELGAEVIKIETIKRPDLRDIIRNEDGTTAIEAKPLFQVINCNKKSFTLNLDTEGGRHLFLDLVKKSDFVVENFRPKTLKRFGLAFDDMALANPELVVVSLSGFGQEGPYEHHSAYGPIVESMSGVRSVLGYVGENRTHLAGVGYSDPVSGAFGALAALVAKRQARTTGAAVHIDYSQVEGLLALVPEVTLEYQILGTSPKPSGNREAGVPPFGVYPCAGEDRWIAIAFRSIHSWPVFCRVLGLGADIHEAYGTVDARRHEAMLLDAIITKATLQEDAYKLAERLQRVGIPASPTHTIKDVLEEKGRFDPGTFIRPLGKSDWRCSYGPVIQVVEPAIRPYEPAPLFGAHNDYVLTDVLGLSLDERLELVRSGVVS